MRTFLIFTLLVSQLFALTIQDLVKNYKNKNYKYVCTNGYKLFNKIKKDENLVSMYAFACLKSDYIDHLAVPILILKNSKYARKNRAYFSLILMQKNLLASSICDGVTFENLHVPTTDYYLSTIFNLYYQKKYKYDDNRYIFKDKNITYILHADQKCHLTIDEIHEKTRKIHKIR
ncbi:hypothetical protein [Nitratiruptor sp. YY09-18]|uniref:hypothetical protein n=1 Tax=Nitratiruptor sp. YY09-18 TaxID=2724901 RepID=UPI001915A37C|nr:hypothetical protein [Nitratiruptor sp. YY09-18]BCD68069.1 hypothetical protein NitYY0918_C0980 [Nitratiruptor sp. YY09-18]